MPLVFGLGGRIGRRSDWFTTDESSLFSCPGAVRDLVELEIGMRARGTVVAEVCVGVEDVVDLYPPSTQAVVGVGELPVGFQDVVRLDMLSDEHEWGELVEEAVLLQVQIDHRHHVLEVVHRALDLLFSIGFKEEYGILQGRANADQPLAEVRREQQRIARLLGFLQNILDTSAEITQPMHVPGAPFPGRRSGRARRAKGTLAHQAVGIAGAVRISDVGGSRRIEQLRSRRRRRWPRHWSR